MTSPFTCVRQMFSRRKKKQCIPVHFFFFNVCLRHRICLHSPGPDYATLPQYKHTHAHKHLYTWAGQEKEVWIMLAQGDREAETELILKTSRTEPRAGEKKTFWTWGSGWGVKVWVIWGSSFSRLHRRLATRTQTEAHKQTPATVHLAVPASLRANQAERNRNTPPTHRRRRDGWTGKEAAGSGGGW